MKLANLLMDRRINIDLKARNKDDAVKELLEMIRQEGIKTDFEEILTCIKEREEES